MPVCANRVGVLTHRLYVGAGRRWWASTRTSHSSEDKGPPLISAGSVLTGGLFSSVRIEPADFRPQAHAFAHRRRAGDSLSGCFPAGGPTPLDRANES